MAKVDSPYSATSAAATSSCVDSGLLAHKATSAPPAWRVSIKFAVSDVTWRHAPTRSPSRGRSRAKRSRMMRSTGIWVAAHSMRRRPCCARPISLTSCRGNVLDDMILFFLPYWLDLRIGQQPSQSLFDLVASEREHAVHAEGLARE